MLKFEENLASRVSGALQPMLGVQVTVTASNGLLATLYADDESTVLPNPQTTDTNGYFGFKAANGEYELTFTGAQIETSKRKIELHDPDDDPPLTLAQASGVTGAERIGGTWFNNKIATLAEIGTEAGATLIGFVQSGVGAVSRSMWDKMSEIRRSPEDYGAIGDGLANDTVPLTKALETGFSIFPPGAIYDLKGATVTITNSLLLSIGAGAKLKNGHLAIRPADATRRLEIVGELLGEGMSFTIAGYLADDGSAVDDAGPQAIRCKVGDITTSGKLSSTTCAIQIANVVDSQFGTLTATGSGMGAAVEGIKLNVIFRSQVGNININGDFSMGCEVSGTSTRPVYAAYRSRFGQVTVRKPTSYTDEPGDHGFYLHGAVECEVAGVNGRGWGSVTGANGSFKFRDNLRCTVNGVDVDAMVFSSNNDGPYQSINELNLLRDVVAGRAYFARTAPGDIKGNVFVNFDCANFGGTASAAVGTIAAYFEGRVRLGNTAAGNYINVGDAVFRNAEVEFIAPYFLRGSRTRAIKSIFRNGLEEQPQSANDVELTDCTIIGDYYYNPTSGTHSHTMRRVTVTGLLRINSFDARVVNADWEFVTSGVNEPAAALQPDNKKYRFVSYLDKLYTTQNVSAAT